MIPKDRRYSDTHEWVKLDGNIATVGITDHAQESLGDITFIELPKTGNSIEKGKECAVIESVKAASDIFSPLDGKITGVNSDLESKPEIINTSPYENGWIFKLEVAESSGIESLMDSDAYKSFLEKNQ